MSCVPTAVQRKRLQELSLKLFKASSKWQKIMRDTRIPYPELDREATVDPNEPKFKMAYRSPTIEETLQALEDNNTAADLSKLPPEELMAKLAKAFCEGTLPVRVAVEVDPADEADLNELLPELDEDLQSRLKSLIVPKGQVPNGAFGVRSVDFVTEVIYLVKPELKEVPAEVEAQ